MDKFWEFYKRKNRIVCAIFVILITGMFAVLLSNKGLPTAEGWYSYYAKCILEGDVVYKDFEYLFTPLYMYFITGVIGLLGYNLIWLRLLGVFVFVTIAVLIYLILTEVFSAEVSAIGACIGAFYLQSEVYTVFYDYVRVMDICALIATLFMVRCLKSWKDNKKTFWLTFFWGVFSALYALVKQNMGGLYCVYSIILILFCAIYYRWGVKTCLKTGLQYLAGIIIPSITLISIIVYNGMWETFINAVFFSAVEAKGGLWVILFRWIITGIPAFGRALLWAVMLCLVIYININITKNYAEKNSSLLKENFSCVFLFLVLMLLGIGRMFSSEKMGRYFSVQRQIDVNVLFIMTLILFVTLLLISICDFIKKEEKANPYIPIFGLLGTYFTTCYGAGMSGGLSIGESSLGLALIIGVVGDSIRYKYGKFVKIGLLMILIYNGLTNIGFKMIHTCNWWGIDESNVYECTEESHISILNGIKLSAHTKEMYENVVDIVQNKTKEEDTIFCFPHIPFMYLMCDRNDPGTMTKVQWFDVSSNEAVKEDIRIIENNLPKAIIIYDLNDAVYEGHESAFNYGTVSGTHEMRDKLYEIVNKYNYQYEGTFSSYNNSLSVFVYRDENVKLETIFDDGIGDKNDPYEISNIQQLVNYSMLVNQGISFDGKYIELTNNISLNNIVWTPIGKYNKEYGNFIYNNYQVYDINCGTKNSNVPFGVTLFE